VEVEERGGLVLSNNVVEGFVVDGGEGDVILVLGGQRRKVDRSTFPRGTVKGSMGVTIGHIPVCLCRDDLVFCINRTSKCSIAVSLQSAGIDGHHRAAIRMEGGGSGDRSVDVIIGHEQCRDDALE
jgi:hypothetical protein